MTATFVSLSIARAMTEYAYTCRRNVFRAAATYVVRDDALVIRAAGGAETTIPLGEILSVRLRDEGTCNNVHLYSCVVRTADRKLVIPSATFIRIGELESQPAEYRAFVRALLDALRPHADSVEFIQGSQAYRVMAFAVLLICLAGIAGVTVGVLSDPNLSVPRLFLAKVVLFLALAPAMVGILRKGRPRAFDPAEMPEAYLP